MENNSIQMVFRFDEIGRKSIFAKCADANGLCPVFKFLNGCGLYHELLHQEPDRIKVMSVKPFESDEMTENAIQLASYLCKKCKNRIR